VVVERGMSYTLCKKGGGVVRERERNVRGIMSGDGICPAGMSGSRL